MKSDANGGTCIKEGMAQDMMRARGLLGEEWELNGLISPMEHDDGA